MRRLLRVVVFINSTLLLLIVCASLSLASDSYSEWIVQNQLPYLLASHQSFKQNNFLYISGGGDSQTYRTDIYKSGINADRTLQNWQKAGDLPEALIWHSSVINNNFLYTLGGAKKDPDINHISTVNTVYKAEISADGSISNWETQNPLPLHIGRGGSFIISNRIYYLGGLLRSANSQLETVSSNVYFAQILQNGDLGPWTQISSLPQALAEFSVFPYGNNVIIAGGMRSNSSASNSVYQGSVNSSSGDIMWNNLPNLPTALRRPASAQIDNKLFLIGGYDGINFTTGTYVAQFNNQNVLSNWQQISPQLPHVDCCNYATSNGNSIYITGGHDGSYYSDVLRLDISSALPVTSIKQYSVPWGTLEYDAAHIWSPGKDTISRFGCALISTSMVLQYYGYSVTPDNLNIWLNNNNGYIPNGLIDWSSITKWVLLQHIINPLLPKLEYGRIVPFSNDSQNTELENNRPTLAKIVRPDGGTHFVVVVGKSDDTYLINDPATIQTFLSYYPSSYLNRIDTFTPSNTDLSYLYFYSSPNTVFSIYDQNGNLATGQQEVEGPYIDQVSQNNSPMITWKTFVKAKPSPGSYVVRLKGNGDYRIISRLYDKVANLTEVKDTGKIAPSQVKTYLFKVGEINQTKIIDFQFIRDYLKEGLISGKIKNKVLYNALLQLLDDAEKVKNKVNGKSSKIIINSIKTTLKASSKLIDANYLTELMKYLGYLDESL